MVAPGDERRRLAVAAAVPWVVWAGLRATGREAGFPLVPALAFTPYAAATTAVPVAVAAWARSGAGALLSAGAGAVLAGSVLRRAAAAPTPVRPDGPRLRLATVSLRKGLVPASAVLDLVRRYEIDVLSVQELTPRAEAALRAAGLDAILPVSHVIPARPGAVIAASGAVWTRRPVVARGTVPGGFEQPTVRLTVDGAPDVEVTAVHTTPPSTSPAAVRGWERDLTALPAPEPGLLRVLAGDFNATLDHAALRALLRRGYADAAVATGRALAWTWRPLRLRFPRLTLDHVLVDPRIDVVSLDLVPIPGSDHLSVVVELALPRR